MGELGRPVSLKMKCPAGRLGSSPSEATNKIIKSHSMSYIEFELYYKLLNMILSGAIPLKD